jgi:hypothetical protein
MSFHRATRVAAAAAVVVLAAAAGAPRADAPPAAGPHDASVVGDADCSACHTTDGWKLIDGTGEGFDHAQTGFPLTGRHAAVSCTDCHKPKRRTVNDCMGCHEDPHRGRLGLACDECHNAVSWQGTRAIRRHRRTRLPLTGVHALLDCRSCHTRTTDRRFDSPPADCFACHEQDYRGDIHPNHQGDPADPSVAPFPRDCARCHRPTGWTPAFLGSSLLSTARRRQALAGHDRRFLVSAGKHRGAPCDRCHVDLRSPRRVRCTGCHAHSAAALRRDHRGEAVARQASACLRCHPGGVAR